MNGSRHLAIGALLALPSNGFAQQATAPSVFFESANTSLSTTDPNRLAPPAGSALRRLTVTQNVDALRSYLSTANIQTVFPDTGNVTTKAAGDRLRRVLGESRLQTAQVVSFDFGRMQAAAAADSMTRLCDGPEPYCSAIQSKRVERRPSGVQEVHATLGGSDGKPQGQAVFVNDEGRVHGVLSVGDRIYLVRQLATRVFVITTNKTEDVERRKNDVLDRKPQSSQAPPAAGFASDQSTNTPDPCPNPATLQTLEVLAMWTHKAWTEAINAGHDMKTLTDVAEVLANTSFRNSNVNGVVRASTGGEVKYSESGDINTDVNELLKPGGQLQDLRDARRRTKADVGVLIIDDPDPTNCGIAPSVGVSKENAFVVVNWKCMTDKFSFIHEIGHLAGAWHDPITDAGQNVQPPYAYGYITTGSQPIATIMAYREACPVKCGRGMYWSNPYTKTQDGQVLGTVKQNFDACIWRQRLPIMVNFDGG